MALPSFWSVERDGDTVVATCPEALQVQSDTRPEWMTHCAAAIRDELRLLAGDAGTMLEATLIRDPSPDAHLESVLLSSVGVPATQVQAGVRLRRSPPGGDGIVQRYRRVPIAEPESEGRGQILAAVVVPVIDGLELESARHVWLAARQAVTAELPAGAEAPSGGLDLRVRLVARTDRRPGSGELVKRLLDGAFAALHVAGGTNLGEVADRLGRELGVEPERIRELASSPRGALLGVCDCLWLHGDGVQVKPAGDRIDAAEIAFVAGPVAQIEIELRSIEPA